MFVVLSFAESFEAAPLRPRPMLVLRTHPSGSSLHALLRERQDGHETPRRDGCRRMWLPLSLQNPNELNTSTLDMLLKPGKTYLSTNESKLFSFVQYFHLK